MPRDSKNRPSHTYPREYLKIFYHILETGNEVVISTLGPDRGPYTALRHSMNSWRAALKREQSPLAPDLFGVVGNPVERIINGKKQWVLVLRKRDAQFGEALAQIQGIEDFTRAPDMSALVDKAKIEIEPEPDLPIQGVMKTIGEVFGEED